MEHVRLGRETTQRVHDVVVVGAGVAGMSVASGLAGRRVALLTRGRMATSGSSPLAQGGVAAAWGPDDSPRLHAADTLAAGAGLSQPAVVEALTRAGVPAIRSVIDRGARFDHAADGALLLGREGAHSRPRIVHAGGDATGAELVRALGRSLRRQAGLEVVEDAVAEDLALHGDEVVGVVVRRGAERELHLGHVVLATGGFGHLYRYTTNPPESRGDGLALAARAGAVLADLEFVQFHPTALRAEIDPLPLVTEALRGAGGRLVDATGERFMPAEHPAAELAPRDVVARAIWKRQQAGRDVFLDVRRLAGLPARFPSVFAACRSVGVDPTTEAIPVTPAAHYAMGGVVTDLRGRSSLAGLWACGEVACTGVHGANRLASNSLLEALVFGQRVARDLEGRPSRTGTRPDRVHVRREAPREGARGAATDALRRLMWDHAGLVRSADGLARAAAWLETHLPDDPEVACLWTVAHLVVGAARWREESRGAHFRADHPRQESAWHRRAFWTYDANPAPELTPVAPGRRDLEIA